MASEDPKSTIIINYIKSLSYREAACDGAVGSVTPTRKLWLAFFTERLPLPRIVRHEMIPSPEGNGLTIDPDKPPEVIEGRAGVVRNVEFGLYLSPSAAKTLHEWLGSQLEEFDKEPK
jgi:hypothetical protein